MSELDAESFDPSKRRLCPDGNCVGLLDDDGRCRVCGVTAGPGAAAPAFPDELAAWESGPDGPHSGHHTGEHDDDLVGGGGFDPARRLCPDGDCVGVLDDGGTCKVCGRDGGTMTSAAE
ncbi:MAG TPA: hypothetical protein VGG33_21540 [Polyangia bacterium]